MSEDKTSGLNDSSRINIDREYEIWYWTDKLKISPEHLKDIVGQVGPLLVDVKRELKRRSAS